MSEVPAVLRNALGQAVARLSGKPLEAGTGMVDEVWKEVTVNTEKLAGCARPHRFNPVGGLQRFGGKHRCELCGGTVNSIDAAWYHRGLVDGRGP